MQDNCLFLKSYLHCKFRENLSTFLHFKVLMLEKHIYNFKYRNNRNSWRQNCISDSFVPSFLI